MAKSGFIAIAGRPNAGKSTLLNELLETKLSIVTPKAQTTRERVLGILTEERGQVVFIDTPGIHKAKQGGINSYMMNEVREALDSPSLIWYLVDPNSGVQHERTVVELLRLSDTPVILVFNKVDLKKNDELELALEAEMREAGVNLQKVCHISALKGAGLGELLEDAWKLMPEGPMFYPDPDQVSDRPTRFFVAEKIREQLLMQLGQEIPYSCAVEIQSFEENKKPVRIEAMIYVERDSQKGMVVGKGGQKIKSIGQAARKEIEEFLGQHVFLGLQVKVLRDWSKDRESLKRLGYNLPNEKRTA